MCGLSQHRGVLEITRFASGGAAAPPTEMSVATSSFSHMCAMWTSRDTARGRETIFD